MTLRTKTALVLLAIVFTVAVSSSHAQEKFRLKPGAKGKVCLTCHESFKEKLKLPFVHTPVRAGDCPDCHNPHTSSYGKLLASNVNRICLSCHDGIVPGKARSTHKVAAGGNCVKCPDPPRAPRQPGGRGPSPPCHKPDAPAFGKAHMGYPVAKSDCSSCHDPHGASTQGILWGKPHQPVANKMCNQCHMDSSSPDALKTRKAGYDLCRGCPNTKMTEILVRKCIDWPGVDRTGWQHGPPPPRPP